MKRLHLFEIEDQAWCPEWLREGITGYLRFTLQIIRPYAPLLPRLASAMRETDEREILDLCSGSGGSWPHLLPALLKSSACERVSLTDKFPNPTAWRGIHALAPSVVTLEPSSVDATRVPSERKGFRTVFTAFHHFRPEAALEILADAVRSGRGIAIFEFTHRGALAIALMCFTGVICLLVTPFIRPFRWSRLLWTYVVPVIPPGVTWDGLVSCVRSYDPDELRLLAQQADPHGTHAWDIGTVRSFSNLVPVTYLIGHPIARRASATTSAA